jgi:hypothetical protein
VLVFRRYLLADIENKELLNWCVPNTSVSSLVLMLDFLPSIC